MISPTKQPRAYKAVFIPLFFVTVVLTGYFFFMLPIDRSLHAEPAIAAPVVAEPNIILVPATIAIAPTSIAVAAAPSDVTPPPAAVAVLIAPKAAQVAQARLEISAIQVDATIKQVGVTSAGAMAVPGNNVDVGWYDLGTTPGKTGTAVIGGHNRWASAPGVFARLNELKKGDIVTVIDTKGLSTSFVVRDIRLFNANDTDSGIFDSKNGAHLNLVTCAGAWDPSIKNYTQRLVIFTDKI